MFYRTDDPVWDAYCRDCAEEEALQRRPKCSVCDEHIADDDAYYINGEWICEDCICVFKKEVTSDGC